MKIEQLAGGTAANQNAYTGLTRQLTVDTDNHDLRLHDGVTPGGRPILSRNNNDARYQLKSSELDGLNFAASDRGFITRIGPGAYRLRVIEVNAAGLVLTNPNGFAGNPLFTLAPTITSPHVFGSTLGVTGVLTATGGVVGAVTGNTAGIHTGNVVGNLTGNAAGSHTGTFTGDVNVVGKTLTLDDNELATSKINGLEAFIKLHAVPAGVIMLWSGLSTAIPAGWVLCNGTLGTPDLRDRFIVGAGGAFAVAATGGAATHSHATTLDNSAGHTHVTTVAGHALAAAELPSHQHLIAKVGVAADVLSGANYVSQETAAGGDTEYRLKGTAGAADVGLSGAVGGGAAHTHAGSTASDGIHNHVVNNPSASTYPPYYALCYIMRVIV